MGDKMTCMPFSQIMNWVLEEKKAGKTVFGTHKKYVAGEEKAEIFGRNLETPIGPAAGPHTQLAQNIIAAYYTGSRFFELKTVQIMDGAELSACVNKPCILAEDEGYNCEWSTELTVPDAMSEYIKAWFALHVMAKEFGLGAQDGFQFNISVGYDLAGIKSEKINHFIDTMMHAGQDATFAECRNWLLENIEKFEHYTKEDVESIPEDICNSATISTLHGCPPHEIESIANYLLTEKHIHTFVKCNPTLLGYEFARKTMDDMGYDYMMFGDFHFKDDLQYGDAVPMFTRLMKLSEELGLSFGVKITNTFPVDVTREELPSEEMYMSGKALFPLSISLAAKLSKEFDGRLRIAYSGGADYFNISRIVGAGIWPVTVATTLLKPGGYNRSAQMAELLAQDGLKPFAGVDVDAVTKLAEDAKRDVHHVKPIKPLPNRKVQDNVPLMDCFMAPCEAGCPIHQDVSNYMELASAGKYEEALEVILDKNPLPFITGTICAHNCMNKCTRNFYEDPVHIRNVKLEAAEKAYDAVMEKLAVPERTAGKKAAVIGGGPTGMAAAYFLARGGADVTVFEKENALGGVVAHVIPDFRISKEAIEKDAAIIRKMGVKVELGKEVSSAKELKDQGFDAVFFAAGAGKPGVLKLEKGEPVDAAEFLKEFKAKDGDVDLGKHVVVIGGGNTAMDTARAAKRTKGVEHVYLVYRRTRRYMPADAEELILVQEEGIEFKELLSPVSMEDGKLLCRKMKLGEMDASGRASVEETGEEETVPADTVIAAVGERVDTALYQANGLPLDNRGKVVADSATLEACSGIYVIGDGLGGPATVVEGIRDAQKAAAAFLQKAVVSELEKEGCEESCYSKKGLLDSEKEPAKESGRCLNCAYVCENCTDVCPNRANIAVKVPGMAMRQIVHVDYMCNECGNCKTFCPYSSAPYKDKFTLFADEADMEDSENNGFVVLDRKEKRVKVRLFGGPVEILLEDEDPAVPAGLRKIMDAVISDYGYMIP